MAHLFIASYWLAMIGTLLLFLFFPAEGPLAFLWHGPMHYIPQSGLYQAAIIPALKQHAMHDVRLDSLRGLVSAPSFHTTAAFLFVAAAWPSKGLRWPILIVNVAMLMAIPVEGTHYLIDMIAGMVVAVLALLIVRALLSHRGQASVGVPQFANPLKP
jgi:membrane-associated phospholipid phosphatase